MGFTKDATTPVTSSNKEAKSASRQHNRAEENKVGVDLNINKKNIFAPQDYVNIINTFESGAADWEEEDYNAAYHYKDVYSTKQFSKRVQDQLEQYPGFHQASKAAKNDPAYTEAKRNADRNLDRWENSLSSPGAFTSELRSRQQDFDYAKIFGSNESKKRKLQEIGKMATECVPCFKRLLDKDDLLPNGDLLEIHGMNVNIRIDHLKQIRNLFSDPGMYIDICEILKLLSKLCPQDLFGLSVLLSQFLAKLNLEVKFNIDLIISLVGSILSPFLDALNQWLDKWIQLILEPMICVVDHINETIILAQNAKIPLSESTGSIDSDINIAGMGQKNASLSGSVGSSFASNRAWADGELERFNTPDNEKYNPQVPYNSEYSEDIIYSAQEAREVWMPSGMPEAQREKRNEEYRAKNLERFAKENEAQWEQIKRQTNNGTRWSKDDIPESEKDTKSAHFSKSILPVEKQQRLKGPEKYWNTAPLTSSIVQIRNIAQTSISYIQDWFTYITQMIYDLLGTEIGWMKNKAGTTKIKSEIIQLLKVIKSIINAVNKNGLQCGASTNLGPEQVKFITEQELNAFTDYDFKVQDDGNIQVTLPGYKKAISSKDDSNLDKDSDSISAQDEIESSVGNISTTPHNKQTYSKSSIIVKSCFNKTDIDNIQKVNKWIDYYERRMANEANAQ